MIQPSQGPNLHQFTALSEYVILLDIMSPPYSEQDHRPCTYFRQVEYSADLSTYPRQKRREKKKRRVVDEGESKEEKESGSQDKNSRCWLVEDPAIDFQCVSRLFEKPLLDLDLLNEFQKRLNEAVKS